MSWRKSAAGKQIGLSWRQAAIRVGIVFATIMVITYKFIVTPAPEQVSACVCRLDIDRALEISPGSNQWILRLIAPSPDWCQGISYTGKKATDYRYFKGEPQCENLTFAYALGLLFSVSSIILLISIALVLSLGLAVKSVRKLPEN